LAKGELDKQSVVEQYRQVIVDVVEQMRGAPSRSHLILFHYLFGIAFTCDELTNVPSNDCEVA
jgi:hypothetical protein